MSDNICISVSDHRGTSHYLINRLKKRYFILAGVAALSFAGAAALSVYSLYQDNQHSSVQLASLQAQAETLQEQAEALSSSLQEENATNVALMDELSEKQVALSVLTQRIDDVETILGLAAEENGAPVSLQERVDSAAISSAVRGTLFRMLPNGNPTPGIRMSSQYGTRVHPVTGKRKRHLGLDFAANIGTKIYAPADGVVEVVRPSNKGSGNFLKLSHTMGFATTYSHLKKFNVRSGTFVRKGDLIGWTGNTGLSTGPHLHYEIRFLGRALNPRPFVEWTPENFDSLFEKEKTVQWASLLKMINNVVSMQVQLTQSPHIARPIQTASNEVKTLGDKAEQVSKL
ncbi:peptidoglycan DD-metalloendopeptidase family protein [Photobacterium aphoticum]|uniref:Peptidase M23 n=1 Tax=Photobacterium aphoticum TaxID=754436 RepID=A0A090QRJ1_9GAMM|nr:M23 family metallopeptidase [Photobacterium aphoticum]KLU99088.1 peptidase M23 [Photobacterium aphoticum]PSU54892.1 M23 family peptidase [Photobacterium aphoticum]GAL04434.1 putative membrane protein [Photobacterium aphoticum]GHA45703.1 peptidase M23 [Photobacterium aphoticum]